MARLSTLCAVLLFSALAFGQSTMVRGYAPCGYGCGPYVPLVTTPMISLQTVSPSPVGATNATGGLSSGASNSTLSNLSASPDAVYTAPVWYEGGSTPYMTPATNPFRGFAHGQEHGEHHAAEQRGNAFYSAPEATSSVTESSAAAKSQKHATRTVTNDDIGRMNQNTGSVKYSGKTEKIN